MNIFREFLIVALPHLDNVMEEHDWDDDPGLSDDWEQMNWEMLVERELFGSDAQLSPLSIWMDKSYFNDEKKHFIVVTKLNSEFLDVRTQKILPTGVPLRFTGFRGPSKLGGFGFYSPFNAVSLYDKEKKDFYTIINEGLEFYLIDWDSYISVSK